MFRAYCAPGGPEQNQRRQRLAHPERPRCPISVQREANWKTAFSAAEHSDAAGTRLARPRTAIYAERATSTRPVLSKKDRTAPAFFGFTLLLPPRRGLRGFQRPTREVVRQPLFPPLRGSFPVGGI